MGQAVKYAALGVALAGVLASVALLIADLTGLIPANGFTTAISNFINTAGTYIRSVRGALNYALGSGGSTALTTLIWVNLFIPLLLIPIRVVITVTRFINQ